MDTVFREFETHGKLALWIERFGLTRIQISIAANILRCPLSSRSKAILLSQVGVKPFQPPASPYIVHKWSQNRCKIIQLQDQAFKLVQVACYGNGGSPTAHLCFVAWVGTVTNDLYVWRDLVQALEQGHSCGITPNKLSDWIGGHREFSYQQKLLLFETVLALVLNPQEISEALALLPPDYNRMLSPDVVNRIEPYLSRQQLEAVINELRALPPVLPQLALPPALTCT
ncbi:MAG: hypothetical protein ACKO7W_09050 [Elainella sp.]